MIKAVFVPDGDMNPDSNKNKKILTMKHLINAEHYLTFGCVVMEELYNVSKTGLDAYVNFNSPNANQVGAHFELPIGHNDTIHT